jgi:Leu/Phe-tRNA-protein transferase
MNKATKELLAAHQEIIDAWYARWLKREKARIDALFRRKAESAFRMENNVMRRSYRRRRFTIPINRSVIAVCQKCNEQFRWLPPNFDMGHRFNRETHEFCGGPIVMQDQKQANAGSVR